MDMDDYDIIEKIHYNFRKTGVGNTFALVVQPASIEQTQLAQMPIEDVTTTLLALLPDSRDEALRYARRVLRYRSPWKVECHISHTRASRQSSSRTEESRSEEMLRNFVAVVIDINDLQLFKDMLLNIILTRIDAIGSLCPAVDHFGWDACLDTIVKRILSTATLRGRCNLIGAIIDASSDSSRTNALLDPLFSLHPWTDVIVNTSLRTCCESYDPDKSSFSRLLKIVNASSPDKLQQMVSVTCPEALMKVVVPALESLKNHMERVLLQSLVDHVSKLLDKMHAVVLNDVFTKVRLPAHCSNCETVQAFLLSPATEATVPFTGALVGAGARLSLERAEAEKARDGVFASLVVELPSTFQREFEAEIATDGAQSQDEMHTWPPRERDNVYDIQYAVFYHNSRCEVEPVATGEALYLVYDLVTTTPSEMSLVAGPKALQRVLDHAITEYFDYVPESLAKQFKISLEVSRTISEFLTDHSFVYRVKRDSFEKLQGDEKRTADRLTAFCEQSQGHYVLYLVTLSCTRRRYARYETTYSVCLSSPCVRLGETRKRLYPHTELDYHGELAHIDFLETLLYEDVNEADESDESDGNDESDDEHVDCETQRNCTHALVVQPATLEHTLWAEKPLQKVIEKLEELVETSREEALRLARRLLPITPEWNNGDTAMMFFLDIVVELDDVLIFNGVLRSIGSFQFEAHWLSRGLRHFGWDACITTIGRILDDTTTTFRSRVNLVCLVLLYFTDTDHTDHLIQKLTSLSPWPGRSASGHFSQPFRRLRPESQPT